MASSDSAIPDINTPGDSTLAQTITETLRILAELNLQNKEYIINKAKKILEMLKERNEMLRGIVSVNRINEIINEVVVLGFCLDKLLKGADEDMLTQDLDLKEFDKFFLHIYLGVATKLSINPEDWPPHLQDEITRSKTALEERIVAIQSKLTEMGFASPIVDEEI